MFSEDQQVHSDEAVKVELSCSFDISNLLMVDVQFIVFSPVGNVCLFAETI